MLGLWPKTLSGAVVVSLPGAYEVGTPVQHPTVSGGAPDHLHPQTQASLCPCKPALTPLPSVPPSSSCPDSFVSSLPFFSTALSAPASSSPLCKCPSLSPVATAECHQPWHVTSRQYTTQRQLLTVFITVLGGPSVRGTRPWPGRE